METLAKVRRGGEQKVIVEHVQVMPGGQAIVGNVSHYGGGGGTHESVDQPHAPIDPKAIALAPGAPVWGQDAGWSTVSVPSGEREGSV